jgi:hypothetical protein
MAAQMKVLQQPSGSNLVEHRQETTASSIQNKLVQIRLEKTKDRNNR